MPRKRIPQISPGFNVGKGGLLPPIKDAERPGATFAQQYEQRAVAEAMRALDMSNQRKSGKVG